MLVRASDRCCCLHSGIRWPRCDPRRSRPQAVAECRQENACRLRRVNVEISHHGHRRLLRTRTERPSRSATDKRDELSPFKLTKLHPLPLARATSIANWRGSSQGLAAMRHFGRLWTGLGHKPRRRSGAGASLCPQCLQSRQNFVHRSERRQVPKAVSSGQTNGYRASAA
jgi:hypothetical protein